ncbi:cell division protein ZapE [Halomonas denitrificans]|nr:AFG1 family ATPase [Halomonas denitrificans]
MPVSSSCPGPAERHRALVEAGRLQPDDAQGAVAGKLQRCFERLQAARPRWFRKPEAVPGLYLHGRVGRGKTLLMDLFVDALEDSGEAVERAHFHRFMDDVHARLKGLGQRQRPLDAIARDLRKRTRVICFDEFHVEDIADAMLLGELTRQWFELGITLVATSNTAPDDLYAGGLQRQRFLPAIEQIHAHCEVVELDAAEDFRLRELARHPTWLTPNDAAADRQLIDEFRALSPKVETEQHVTLTVRGRPMEARARAGSLAWFEFDELCRGARSSGDYLELTYRFSTLLVANVPQLDDDDNNAARRFIHLVDACYDRNVKLIASAETGIDELYTGKKLSAPFQRTRSRLVEMQSKDYLARPHRP